MSLVLAPVQGGDLNRHCGTQSGSCYLQLPLTLRTVTILWALHSCLLLLETLASAGEGQSQLVCLPSRASLSRLSTGTPHRCWAATAECELSHTVAFPSPVQPPTTNGSQRKGRNVPLSKRGETSLLPKEPQTASC